MLTAIPVRFPNDTLMLVHHKFCLIDAEQPQSPTPRLVYGSPAAVPAAVQSGAPIRLPKGGVLLNGSMNWTMQVVQMFFNAMSTLSIHYRICR